jgi:hypothetical protein
MNYPLLYQWEELLSAHLSCLNSWQRANVALFSYGIIRAESCQQGSVARQVSCGERVESTARRWRRFLDNEKFPLQAFFQQWSRWVSTMVGQQEITLLVDETKIEDRIGAMIVGLANLSRQQCGGLPGRRSGRHDC